MSEHAKVKQVICVRRDLKCRRGKMMAQVAHASLAAVLSLMHMNTRCFIEDEKILNYDEYNFRVYHSDPVHEWLRDKFTKIVVGVPDEQNLLLLRDQAKEKKIPHALIVDCGITEFHDVPTTTALALGPARSEVLDELTKDLILL